MVQGRGSSRVLLVAVVLIPLLAAGCIDALRAELDPLVYEPEADPPPPPDERLGLGGTSKIRDLAWTHETVRIPSFDGIELEADYWRPVVNDSEKVPVVIIISPYFLGAKVAELGNLPEDGLYRQIVDELVPRGYAAGLVDLRGTRNSDGCIDLAGPNEQKDAYEVVEWFGTQPWSNGKVGMVGVSYDGLTQIEAAAMNPPHLAAVVPIAPVTDWYHAVGKGGAKYDGWTPMTPLLYNWFIGMEGGDLANDARRGFLLDRLEHQDCMVKNQVWSDDPSGDYNAWMKERDLRALAKTAQAPMYYVHGFTDVNARPDHIDPWYNDYAGPKRAFLWQAPHTMPDEDTTGRAFWFDSVIKWFDHWLLGIPNDVPATLGTVEVQDNLGRWRFESAWPPPDRGNFTLFLGDGVLVAGESAGASPGGAPETLREAPFETSHRLGYRSGKIGSSESASRLVFQSGVLDADVHYAGRPRVDVFVSSDKPNALVVAHLYEVHRDGSWVLLNLGPGTIRHRDGLDRPAPGVPGEVYKVTIEMQPGDFVFRAGTAIGLTLTGADQGYVVPTGGGAISTVHYGDSAPSALTLPRIERASFAFESWGPQQPPWMGPNQAEVEP